MRDALPLHSTAAVRAIDASAIAGGIPGIELMRRAGAAAFDVARARWPQATRWLVLCGPGNNGGDGYVVARLAAKAGIAVRLVLLDQVATPGADARLAREAWLEVGGKEEIASERTSLEDIDLVVDGLYGIGLSRPPAGIAAHLISCVNASRLPVLALDVPSGVDADRGGVPGVAIRSALTISFIAAKRGLFTGPALDAVGERVLADLDVPPEAFANQPPAAWAVDAGALAQLPRRSRNAHKGRHGHVLAVGGDSGAGGALRLCVDAALRAGAGLVSALTRPEHVAPLLAARPECMWHASASGELSADLLARASVIALGPGLGQNGWGRTLFDALVEDGRPGVIDADALNLLAAHPRQLPGKVLTPHPGEAARLLGSSSGAVQADRYGALQALVERYAATVVLKGAGTLVGAPGRTPVLIRAGNPGMACGGMGDVLTGVIAALLAQGLVDFEAAWLGALLHSVAGDRAARDGGERGLLASDLLEWLRGERAGRPNG